MLIFISQLLKIYFEREVKECIYKRKSGTFQYIPDKGFSGKDTFEYNVVLVIDCKEYIKSAKVTINVIPKQPETPSETASEKETPTPTETVSEKES